MKRLLLVVSVLFLLLPGQQVAASPMRDKGASEHGAEVETLTGATSGLPLLRRVARMTPFWRSLGYKPSRAHCLRDLECISKYCRNGFCSRPHLES